MVRIAGIEKNDFTNGQGTCVSIFLQGCPFHCPGCHNPETWNPNGGVERDESELIQEILKAIKANGIQRNLSILGGEPLDTKEKIIFINTLIDQAKQNFPDIKIFVWTGFHYEDIQDKEEYQYILNNIDYLIEGPFILDQRDITLKWRGSRNQRVLDMKQSIKKGTIEVYNDKLS